MNRPAEYEAWYRCNLCGAEAKSLTVGKRRWIVSYCNWKQKMSRLYRISPPVRINLHRGA